jgi:hypothetical protein
LAHCGIIQPPNFVHIPCSLLPVNGSVKVEDDKYTNYKFFPFSIEFPLPWIGWVPARGKRCCRRFKTRRQWTRSGRYVVISEHTRVIGWEKVREGDRVAAGASREAKQTWGWDLESRVLLLLVWGLCNLILRLPCCLSAMPSHFSLRGHMPNPLRNKWLALGLTFDPSPFSRYLCACLGNGNTEEEQTRAVASYNRLGLSQRSKLP